MKLLRATSLILFAFSVVVVPSGAQSWQPLYNQPPFQTDTALLLTDGTVMVHEYATPNWWRLTPDINGSYANGTWSQLSSMPPSYGPYAFASAVLPDGRVVVAGGEFNFGKGQYQDVSVIYDPTTNTWTQFDPPSGWSTIGDAASVVLADGTFMLAGALSANWALLNAQTLTWSTFSGKLFSDLEAGWTLLPDGSVLEVPVYPPNSERYLPGPNAWVFAGDVPVSLVQYVEIGPQTLRPDGTVLVNGATGHNAIYRAEDFIAAKWGAGPDFPNGDDMADAPAALLPNGNVLCETSIGFGSPPVTFYEFDGKAMNQVLPPADPGNNSTTGRFLVLPTGEIFFVVGDGMTIDAELYTTKGTYQQSWEPTITSAPGTVTRGETYQISGTQFNGLSQGAMYGDDAQMATNYPLVRITNQSSGHIFYARTHDHSSMGVATGNLPVSTFFDVPADMETGAGELVVVANGIPSEPVAVTVQ